MCVDSENYQRKKTSLGESLAESLADTLDKTFGETVGETFRTKKSHRVSRIGLYASHSQ